MKVKFPVFFLSKHSDTHLTLVSIPITHQVVKMQFAYLTVLSYLLAIGSAAPVAHSG
jgi:hypothetical protein